MEKKKRKSRKRIIEVWHAVVTPNGTIFLMAPTVVDAVIGYEAVFRPWYDAVLEGWSIRKVHVTIVKD